MKKNILNIFTALAFMTGASGFAQGNSLDFNGTSITLGTEGASDINLFTVTDRTIECWFQADAIGNATKQVIYEEGGKINGFNIYIESDTLYCGLWGNVDSFSDGTYLATTDIVNGQWHHVAFTLTGGTSTQQADIFKAYLDGVEYGSGPATHIPSHSGSVGWGNQTGRTQFHDGDSDPADNFYYDGKLEDFKIWNVARTADQIREGMNTQLSTPVTGLVLYYDFDDTAAGFGITDISGVVPSHDGNVIDDDGIITERPTGTSDIYTSWNTGNSSTDWTSGSNWSNGVPGSSTSGLLKIPSGGTQPIITTAVTGKNLQIENGATLEIGSSGTLNLSGSAEINGAEALVIKSDATGTGNFIDGGVSYKNSGSVKVERYIPFIGGTYPEGYHYISSPINNHNNLTGMSSLYSYSEASLLWSHYLGTNSFSSFNNGVGYAYKYTSTVTQEFTGSVNTGDYTVAITSTNHGGDVFEHFNLIGNPYPSSISADSIVDNNSIINANVYFWNGEDYATYNTGTNAGTAGSIGSTPDGQIAVGQAFYVDANASGNLTLSNSMRGTDSNIFYREESYPQLRVVLTSNYGKSDLFLTGHKASTFGLDNYDAKHLPGNGNLSLSALMDGVAYDIQSVPQINANAFDLQVVAKQDDQIRFALQEVKDLNGMHVYLEDRETGTVTDISTDSYTAHITEGTSNNRFKLRIAKEEAAFTAWINNGRVEAFMEGETAQSIRLIALDGKTVASSNNMQFNNWNQLANGVYLLEVETTERKHIQKIIK